MKYCIALLLKITFCNTASEQCFQFVSWKNTSQTLKVITYLAILYVKWIEGWRMRTEARFEIPIWIHWVFLSDSLKDLARMSHLFMNHTGHAVYHRYIVLETLKMNNTLEKQQYNDANRCENYDSRHTNLENLFYFTQGWSAPHGCRPVNFTCRAD